MVIWELPAATVERPHALKYRLYCGEAGRCIVRYDNEAGKGELFSAITEKRLELLRFVAGHDGLNVRNLAAGLDRDYKNVHTDVAELIALGLLDRADNGTLVAPFDEIVIHAGIRDAA